MRIVIETIPHKQQRYDTCGDWTVDGDTVTIYVSEMGDWRKEMAVAYHELREYLLCKHLGISQESVDSFDIEYEKNRKEGDTSEPGDDPKAPYYIPHQYATHDERNLIADLGVNWDEYNTLIQSLSWND